MTIKLNTFVWAQLDPQSRKNALMRPALRVDADITARVVELIRRVRQDGDKAIRQLTLELDGVDLSQFQVSEEEADRAEAELSPEARQAIMTAAANVSRFHEAQITSPVRVETSPEDIRGMQASRGILTARGGMTSHAALVARQMGKVCVAGAGELVIDYKKKSMIVGKRKYAEGDWLSLDGTTGEVIEGQADGLRLFLGDVGDPAASKPIDFFLIEDGVED